jgi:hypothetical protein
LLGQPFQLEKVHHLLGDTHSGGSTSEEDNPVVFQWLARGFTGLTSGGKETTENDGTSSLNVVVEHAVLALVSLQEVESGFRVEIFVLNDDFWEGLVGGGHELVHELGSLGEVDTRSSETNVEGVISDLFSVGSHATS